MSNDKWKNPENEAIYVSEEIKMNKPSKTKVQELLALLSDERKSLIQIDNDGLHKTLNKLRALRQRIVRRGDTGGFWVLLVIFLLGCIFYIIGEVVSRLYR